MERVALHLAPVARLEHRRVGVGVHGLADGHPAVGDGHRGVGERRAAGVEQLGGVEDREEVLALAVGAEDVGQLAHQRHQAVEVVEQRVDLGEGLVAGVAEPGSRRSGGLDGGQARAGPGELGLGVAGGGHEPLERGDVDVPPSKKVASSPVISG